MTLPEDDDKALAESNARRRRRRATKTEWVEEIRIEFYHYMANINYADYTDATPYPDEQALMNSIVKDLAILSHNLAVRRGDADRGFIDIPHYHYNNAGPE